MVHERRTSATNAGARRRRLLEKPFRFASSIARSRVIVIYPFSDAKRVELSAGVQSITFNRTTTSSVYSEQNGQLLRRTTTTVPAARPALLAESGAALVYDTAVFGPTSPILGQRYRFAIAPTFGDLAFTSVTADYRRYLMPVRPFTIATRVMHLGRYGGGSDDPRLLPLVFTMRDVVRGYGDTGRTGGSDSALSATRMLVANLEMRFPYARAVEQARAFACAADRGPCLLRCGTVLVAARTLGSRFRNAAKRWRRGSG